MTIPGPLVRIVQTCSAAPSQWNSWDDTGQYWYLRFRHGRGTVTPYDAPDSAEDIKPPVIEFRTSRDMGDSYMSLDEFASHAGLKIACTEDKLDEDT